ncbi:MAG: hypothetical protein LBN06_12150 [Prevotellaceae bacterium]|jgi:hypothetical protein|nr:hypothetical protein [Prevotellaceae bacterium]
MKQPLTLAKARKVLKLINGESITERQLGHDLTNDLIKEGIAVSRSYGSIVRLTLVAPNALNVFLSQHYDVQIPLEEWIAVKECDSPLSRADYVDAVGDSKFKRVRSFTGFPINCVEPVEISLQDQSVTLTPMPGASFFIEDYTRFRIPVDALVVGIENGENFQRLREQRYLFPRDCPVVFVSRYPQSNDLRTWLQQIPNRYLHFGDFDLAGISIYLTEFYASLSNRAEFFIPADIEARIRDKGNRSLYQNQYLRYEKMDVADERVKPLVEMIHRYRRGYEQEGYIHELANDCCL